MTVLTLYSNSYSNNSSSAGSWVNPAYGCNASEPDGLYASTPLLSRGTSATIFYLFDTSSIPSNAVISSIQYQVYTEHTNASALSTLTANLYNINGSLGTSGAVALNTSWSNIGGTVNSISTLEQLSVNITISQPTTKQTDYIYIDYVKVIITYTAYNLIEMTSLTTTPDKTSCNVTFNTNIGCYYNIYYRTVGGSYATYSSPVASNTTHNTTLSSLTSGTAYEYYISLTEYSNSLNTKDYGSQTTPYGTFTTLNSLSISNVGASTTGDSYTSISWNTTISSTSKVVYASSVDDLNLGLGTVLNIEDTSTSHAVIIKNLLSTIYFFYVESTDGTDTVQDNNGGTYYSFEIMDTTFPSIQDLSVTDINGNSAIIRFALSEYGSITIRYSSQWNTDYSLISYNYILQDITNETVAISITGLSPNTTYMYEIDIYDLNGNNNYVKTVDEITVYNFTTTQNTTPTDGYEIQKQINNSGIWTSLDIVDNTTFLYDDYDILGDTIYKYRVRRITSDTESNWSNEVTVTTVSTVNKSGSDSVTLTSTEDLNNVFISLSSDDAFTAISDDIVSTITRVLIDSYTITLDETVSGITEGIIDTFAMVLDDTFTDILTNLLTNDAHTFSIDEVSSLSIEITDGYEIERQIDNNGTWTLIEKTDNATTLFDDYDIIGDTIYSYRVRRFVSDVVSDWSNTATLTYSPLITNKSADDIISLTLVDNLEVSVSISQKTDSGTIVLIDTLSSIVSNSSFSDASYITYTDTLLDTYNTLLSTDTIIISIVEVSAYEHILEIKADSISFTGQESAILQATASGVDPPSVINFTESSSLMFNTANMSLVDTVLITATDVLGIVNKFINDTVSVSSVETTVSNNKNITANDTKALTITESLSDIEISCIDSSTLTITEILSNFKISYVDSPNLTITESLPNIKISCADSLNLIITESLSYIKVSCSDSLNLNTIESLSNIKVSCADNLNLNVTDSLSNIKISCIDSTNLNITESVSQNINVQSSDAYSLAISETSTYSYGFSINDTLLLGILETSIVSNTLSLNDTSTLLLDESIVKNNVSFSDILTATLQDNLYSIKTTSSDSSSVSLAEGILVNAGFNPIDSIALSSFETMGLSIQLSSSDSSVVSILDSAYRTSDSIYNDIAVMQTLEVSYVDVSYNLYDTFTSIIEDNYINIKISVIDEPVTALSETSNANNTVNLVDSCILTSQELHILIEVKADENFVLSAFDLSQINSDILVYDDINVVLYELNINGYNVFSSDSYIISVIETLDLDNHFIQNDTYSILITDSVILANGISVTDSYTINSTENFMLKVMSVDAFNISESSTCILNCSMQLSDIVIANCLEVLNIGIPLSDSLQSLSLLEISKIADIQVNLVDTFSIGIAENLESYFNINQNVNDSYSISISELSAIETYLLDSDSISTAITDDTDISYDPYTIDEIALVFTESADRGLYVEGFDTFVIETIETFTAKSIGSIDTSILDIFETFETSCSISNDDITLLNALGSGLIDASIVANDTGLIGIGSSEIHYCEKVAEDVLSIRFTESSLNKEPNGFIYIGTVTYQSRDIKLNGLFRTPNVNISPRLALLYLKDRMPTIYVKERTVIMEVVKMPLIGDTVRLIAEFKNWNGVNADPTSITLKFYDDTKKQIGATIILDSKNKIEVGKYSYDYTIPQIPRPVIVYEFSGTLEEKPIVCRGIIEKEWAKDKTHKIL